MSHWLMNHMMLHGLRQVQKLFMLMMHLLTIMLLKAQNLSFFLFLAKPFLLTADGTVTGAAVVAAAFGAGAAATGAVAVGASWPSSAASRAA